MRVSPRRMFHVAAMVVVFSQSWAAYAQDSVSITSPAGNPGPTWTVGNPYGVDASITGNAPVSKVRVTIYPTGNPNNPLLVNTSSYFPFWFVNFDCPNSGEKYELVPCTILVEAIGADGVTVVGSGTAFVGIVGGY